jgi:hypothetical protein
MSHQPSSAPVIPYDYPTTRQLPDWRKSLVWPLAFRDAFALSDSGIRSVLAWINDISNDDERRIALQAAPVCVAFVRSLTEASVVAHRARAQGFRMSGGMTDVLEGSADDIDRLVGSIIAQATSRLRAPGPNMPWLRGVARASSWTPAWKLPRTVLAPGVIAVSHNALLREAASHSADAIGFDHAGAILAKARRQPAAARAVAPAELAAAMVTALTEHDAIPAELRPALAAVVRPFVGQMLKLAAADLAGLAATKRLPNKLWSGSGGVAAPRAIGLEVLRRGGEVTRFDHGGCTPLVGPAEQTVLGELSVSSRFGLATEKAAAEFAKINTGRFTASYRQCSVFGVGNDPTYRGLPLTSTRQPARRRVVYAPSALIDGRQYHPPLLPSPVYLDWQLRLAELLKAMPIDLICQPHPEGVVAGSKHPLASIATTHDGRFESLMADADVFVFDYGQSTVVTEAMCTDRIVVLIDLGNPVWTPNASAIIERRCRVVRTQYDERNLPQADAAQLCEAVCGGGLRADPSELQSLLM